MKSLLRLKAEVVAGSLLLTVAWELVEVTSLRCSFKGEPSPHHPLPRLPLSELARRLGRSLG